jgi:hypothetical protein
MKKLSILPLFILLASLSGFSQYHISKDSLINQMQKGAPEKHIFVTGNDLQTIACLDKNENAVNLEITNRTGIRIIRKDNSKKTFYLNTVIITDSTIGGSKTHFFNAQIKAIRFSDIDKIEILK